MTNISKEDVFNERFSKLKAEFEAQLTEEARLSALIAENLGKVKRNLSDNEEKESRKKGSQKGWSKLTDKQQELLDMLEGKY